ncbi:MAG: SprT family zinc-dependent metalloprotease [Pseudomonadota bacterium]
MGILGRKSVAPPTSVWIDPPGVEIAIRTHVRARRFTLRVTSDGAGAVLTMPPGTPLVLAEGFLAEHAGWLTRALADRPERVRIADGTMLPVDGAPVPVALVRGARVAPRLVDGRLTLAPGAAPGQRVAAWLRERLRARAVPAVHRYAARIDRRCTGVSLRDTRSRWGSCTSTGRISLSWRLAMAPPEVQDYVTAHEVAHLAEMNHSPRFWAVLEGLMADYAQHRAWLRRDGRALHAIDFSC